MRRIYNWTQYKILLESEGVSQSSDYNISSEARFKVLAIKGTFHQKLPFFSDLVKKLEFIEDKNLPYKTMATDGYKIYYDPGFVMKQTVEEIHWVVIHEIMHCIFAHFARKMSDARLWNAATDYAINLTIHHSENPNYGKMPEGALYDTKYKGWSAERIYNHLLENQDQVPPEEGWNYGGVYPPDKVPGVSKGGSKKGSDQQQESPQKIIKIGNYVKLPNGGYGRVDDINDQNGDVTITPLTEDEVIAEIETNSGRKIQKIY